MLKNTISIQALIFTIIRKIKVSIGALLTTNWYVTLFTSQCFTNAKSIQNYRPFVAKPSRDLLFIKLWAIA